MNKVYYLSDTSLSENNKELQKYGKGCVKEQPRQVKKDGSVSTVVKPTERVRIIFQT